MNFKQAKQISIDEYGVSVWTDGNGNYQRRNIDGEVVEQWTEKQFTLPKIGIASAAVLGFAILFGAMTYSDHKERAAKQAAHEKKVLAAKYETAHPRARAALVRMMHIGISANDAKNRRDKVAWKLSCNFYYTVKRNNYEPGAWTLNGYGESLISKIEYHICSNFDFDRIDSKKFKNEVIRYGLYN